MQQYLKIDQMIPCVFKDVAGNILYAFFSLLNFCDDCVKFIV